MTDSPESSLTVRRIRADEWELVRSLRLAATADPDAGIAFLETHESASAHPEEFWVTRTEDAALSETVAQFLAVSDGDVVGTASVLVRATGQRDHLGRIVDDRRADVVGVYVDPAGRGTGAIDALLAAAGAWVATLGLREIHLDVHRDNLRAQGAYRRAGFAPTGETLTGPIGPELVMAKRLA
ncbi:acetyltransferase [Microbacterium sp. Root61]|uniref:GNAT family N-acetyltransferase n=1 Tax=Microbacterium sp. Root61 TaxID=1736570 RepID=UPI0006FA50BD|nr:GNAT family N-acetyltransferase [Microbacterium sp. Root61]KRA23468.1 acetyltransferase [Microbacterium sp. Root61]